MKSYFLFLLISIICLGCEKKASTETEETPKLGQLNVQYINGFHSDTVLGYIDGNFQIISRTTTDTIPEGVTGWSCPNLTIGAHILTIWIANTNISADTTFILPKNQLYIGVYYLRSEKKIFYKFSNSSIMR